LYLLLFTSVGGYFFFLPFRATIGTPGCIETPFAPKIDVSSAVFSAAHVNAISTDINFTTSKITRPSSRIEDFFFVMRQTDAHRITSSVC
jgi:hypothetical protein